MAIAAPLRLLGGIACATLLASAHPKINTWPLAFVALAGFFALWSRMRPLTAALHGALVGLVYVAIVCSWIGDTAGAELGPFAFVLNVGPALVELPYFAATAAIVSLLARRAPALAAAIGSAAAFAFFEWLRGIGVMGAPLGQLGMPFVQTPFAAIAAFAGTFGITFVVALVSALCAFAFAPFAGRRDGRPPTSAEERARSRTGRSIVALAAVVLVLPAMLANALWPATRGPLAHTTVVAAVQGNIKQAIKWQNNTLAISVERYVSMTQALAPQHPALVVWPETVITTNLAFHENQPLLARFQALARTMHTTLVVGAQSAIPTGEYFNALYFIAPSGSIETIYRKRQLVPFAEKLPAEWLRGLPFTNLISDFTRGTEPTVVDAGGLRLAPSICWETGFGDLIHDQLANGAGTLVAATDDAWFGVTAGPYQQAQIAQMRAIESGRWVVRAAATGISGIVAPTGRFTAEVPLETQRSVVGTIGPPAPTLYATIGPTPIAALLAFIMLAPFAIPRARTR